MASSYPATIDVFSNPSGASTLGAAGHSSLHGEERDAIENIEAVLGTTAGTSVLKSFSAGQFPARVNSGGTIVQVLTGGTINTTTMGTPSVTAGTFSKPAINAFYDTPQTYTGTAGGTTTLDLSLSNEHRITMPNSAGSVTLAVSNATNGQKFITSILQGTAGSGTIGWFATIRWAGGIVGTATTTANKRDIYGFVVTGSNTFDGVTIGTAF